MESSRPPIPSREEYGPPERESLAPLEWELVDDRLTQARNYWLGTARRDGRPHVVAVWAVWFDELLSFVTSPETVTARILAENPYALVHLEDAREVTIVEGTCSRLGPEEVPPRVIEMYDEKYGSPAPADDEGMPYFVLRPRIVLAWHASDIRGTARRWRLS